MSRRRSEFKPWSSDFKYGAFLFLAGVVALFVAWRDTSLAPALAGVALVWIGQGKLRRGHYRRRGKRIEVAALREKDLPRGWSFQAGRRLQSGGDVDFFVQSPDREKRFAIEHKTFESLVVRHSWFGLGEPRFEMSNGKPLRGDPVGQTLRNAAAVGATPVLWLSRGNAKTIRMRGGLIIVQGGRSRLLRAIGARSFFIFF